MNNIQALHRPTRTAHLQQRITGPYPESDKSMIYSFIVFNMHFNIILSSTPRSNKWSLYLHTL